MSCFYNKTDKAITEAYYGCLVPAMSYVDLPNELSYYGIYRNIKEIPGAFGITNDMNFPKVIPQSKRYEYKHYRSIYHKDTNTIESCIVPSVQEGTEIIVKDSGGGNILTAVKDGLTATLNKCAANKKPCLYKGRARYPVFLAPDGINEDFGRTGDYHVSLFSPPPGTLRLDVTGDETMKGEAIIALLYDAGKKATYVCRARFSASKASTSLTPHDFTTKADSGIDYLSSFTKGSTCRVYNNFFDGKNFTDWPVQTSKEFTF
jgi:hypothetical protein|nr:MAG TPA: hypothetical protein [Caudoviricetes sp.]